MQRAALCGVGREAPREKARPTRAHGRRPSQLLRGDGPPPACWRGTRKPARTGDTDIAEALLRTGSPRCDRAIACRRYPACSRSGRLHSLGRYGRRDAGEQAPAGRGHAVPEAGARGDPVIRRVIGMLLAPVRVLVVCAEGNHDPASSILRLREWLAAVKTSCACRLTAHPTRTTASSTATPRCSSITATSASRPTWIRCSPISSARCSGERSTPMHTSATCTISTRRKTNLMVVEQHRTLAAPDAYARAAAG